MREEHPIDRLLAVVEGAAPASVATLLERSALDLSGRRSWIIGPPEFVDDWNSSHDRTTGLSLSVYTALPPWGAELDPESDLAHLEEVKELLRELCRVSAEHDVTFVVEFAGELIGTIQAGQMDDSLNIGLIGEWERMLNS